MDIFITYVIFVCFSIIVLHFWVILYTDLGYNLWNNLPSDVVSAPSVNAFKERLDKHWKEYCFTLDPEDFIRR